MKNRFEEMNDMGSMVKPLLIGVSARALFNLDYATGILQKDGLDSYREYQRQGHSLPFRQENAGFELHRPR